MPTTVPAKRRRQASKSTNGDAAVGTFNAVYDEIRARIIVGSLKGGEVLVEQDMLLQAQFLVLGATDYVKSL